VATPEEYAALWMPDEDNSLAALTGRFDAWMCSYEQSQVEAIGSGLLTLRRRPGVATWFAWEDMPPMAGPAGEAVVQGFRQRDFLADHPSPPSAEGEGGAADQSLLPVCFRLHPALRCQHELVVEPSGWALAGTRLEFREGLLFGLQIDQVCMAFLSRCHGDRPLQAVLSETAGALHLDPGRLSGALMPFIRCLIEQGFLLPVGPKG
jgi:hypothetical protein